MSYVDKKVITIGIVSKLTGLSVRQIRYYEDRQLIFPVRTEGGTRTYSFADVEKLMDIAMQLEKGYHTVEIKEGLLLGSKSTISTD